MSESSFSEPKFLALKQLQELIDALLELGYDVVGPKIEQQAIVYRSVRNASELPRGWSDDQQPAVYQITKRSHDRYFFFNSSPDSWKRFLFPSTMELGTAVLDDGGWHFDTNRAEVPRFAFLGVRACDLAAIAVQDRVFRDNSYVDHAYANRRQAAFIIAVQCSTAASTCFCTSMGTGPECHSGFDLVMTETLGGFVIAAGSASGERVLQRLQLGDASELQISVAADEVANARGTISKHLDRDGLHDLMLENLEHPHWKEVSGRCLSCANCTMVCPTCFCSTVDDVSNLSQTNVTRVRTWDSCFNLEFSYTAGGTVRNDVRSRYRQWLTHKFATWEDQFDTSGCVGCGRCITWCPVGIDVTQELTALRSPAGNDLANVQIIE